MPRARRRAQTRGTPGLRPLAHSPWRDPRYLALTALSAVFGMQFGVGEVGVPLWIANDTNAPEVLVAVVLILNTIIVVLFQVPLSRGTHDLRRAGRVSAIAAWLMAAACLIYAAAAGLPAGFAIAVIVAAAIAHAFAEVLSQAGGWGLSFELADPVQRRHLPGRVLDGLLARSHGRAAVRDVDRAHPRVRRLGDPRRRVPRLGPRHVGDRRGRGTGDRRRRTSATLDRLTGASAMVAA